MEPPGGIFLNPRSRLAVAIPLVVFLVTSASARAQTIVHQITLPAGVTWCDDSMINGLFSDINSFRVGQGVPALAENSLGMKDAEMRAVQLSIYMATNPPNEPGWDPHTGYDTTAAGLGYDLVSENLAWVASDPSYIVDSVWQDSLHLAAMLSTSANVAGVSCVYSNGWPYWTYEPGIGQGSSSPPPTPPSSPIVDPAITAPALDSEAAALLTLINNFRTQNGVPPLQVSATLQAAAQWMSADMAAGNILSHTDTLGRGTEARLVAFGYDYSPWGENLGAGDTDAQDIFSDFETACDPDASGNCTYEHRTNMLSANFTAIGLARAYGASSAYGWYWTTDFGGYLDKPLLPVTASLPVISSFVATPTTITTGQTAKLSWSISGETSVSLNNGIGTVTNESSVSVDPLQSTTYQITATNSAGSVTAKVTLTVEPAIKDTLPPTAPGLKSATVKSSNEVDLGWTASTDNVGVAGYQVIRNGSDVAQVSGNTLTFDDTTVNPSTSYTYTIKAFDAAGNISPASNSITVGTPAAPSTPTPVVCPAPANGAFTGCYYNNVLWIGNPVFTRKDSQINFNWATTPPSSLVPLSEFSVQWEGNFTFGNGSYIFTTKCTGGVRLFVDGGLLLDIPPDWTLETAYAGLALTQGQHMVKVEYYNESGDATALVSWAEATN